MSLSIARLRVWLLVGATLLVLVIAGFLGYARYRQHRFLAGLPGKLGIDIRRETNGYTWSQSVKGKTVVTLHAAKAIEHNNGKLTLHDVGMILYGRKQERADRISGAQFEFDPQAGVVRAVGEVHIDLQAPPPAGARAKEDKAAAAPSTAPSLKDAADEENKRIIHVKTSGLVYLQKLGVAATDQDLEFMFGGMTGHATGAEYNSDTGVLILQSAVKANGLQHGRPVVLTASHAEMERMSQVALLTQAKYVTSEQTVRGDHAIVHLRSDGSPERIEAEGHVALGESSGGLITAPRADVALNAAGQPQKAHLSGAGGVHFTEDNRLREAKGQADQAEVAFDAGGQPETVLLTGSVRLNERVRASEAIGSAWHTREATAEKMTLALASGAVGGKQELRQVDAVGAAHMTLVGEGSATSEIAGDRLRGYFTGAGKAALLSKIEGSGHTSLRQVGARGQEQTSAGDTLSVDLRSAPKKVSASQAGQTSQAGREEIARAVQTGHVVMTSRSAAKPGKDVPATTRATADLGVYDGDADHLTLTGHAQVVDQGNTVAANRIVMEHASGDATAEGAVKANYRQPDSTEPVHVLAERAEMAHDAGLVVFRGGASPARMWQGSSQVEAPTIELDQAKKSMNAHGDARAVSPVHAVLVGKSAANAGKTKAGNRMRPEVARITSQTMVYLEVSRQVEFAGGVKVEDAAGMLRAWQATAFLQAAPAAGTVAARKDASTSGGFFGGSVERIVASGKVELEQPGRRAAGEELVYTVSDALFVLTGTPAALPKLIDEVQGTVTGTELSFHTGDDSVVVTGDVATPEQRVHTVTRVKQK